MALAADRITKKKVPGEMSYPVKASTLIYAGGLVGIDSASGFAVPAAEAAGMIVVGVAKHRADNSAGLDGAIRVNVEAPIVALFAATSITQAMVGEKMFLVDDQTFDETAGANSVVAGTLVEFVSTTSGWIYIDPTQHL